MPSFELVRNDYLTIVVIFCVFVVELLFYCQYEATKTANLLSETQELKDRLGYKDTEKKVVGSRETRAKFAFGLEASIEESKTHIKNVRFEVESDKNQILIITADGITARDCQDFAFGEIGKAAADPGGFEKITCRNRISNGKWSLVL